MPALVVVDVDGLVVLAEHLWMGEDFPAYVADHALGVAVVMNGNVDVQVLRRGKFDKTIMKIYLAPNSWPQTKLELRRF